MLLTQAISTNSYDTQLCFPYSNTITERSRIATVCNAVLRCTELSGIIQILNGEKISNAEDSSYQTNITEILQIVSQRVPSSNTKQEEDEEFPKERDVFAQMSLG